MHRGFEKIKKGERDSYQHFSQAPLQRMKQISCGIIFTLVAMVVFSVSLISQYIRSTSEVENLSFLVFGLNERLAKIEEKQNKSDPLMMDLKSINLSKQQQAIQISVLQQKNEQIFEFISSLKPVVESLQKELVKAQSDILVTGTQINYNAKIIDKVVQKVDELEKEQRNILINENNLTTRANSSSNIIDQILAKVEVFEKDQRDIAISQNSLSTSVNSFQNKIDQVQTKVDVLEKDQIRIRQSENNISTQVNSNSNRIDSIQIKVDALEKDHQDNLTNQSILTSQVNSNINKIDQLTTEIDILSTFSAKVDSLSQDVPTIQDTINTLNLKINSDTFNKVELFGPYYPNSHLIQMTVTNSGFTLFQTVQPCIISLNGKAIVTLIATGHSNITGNFGLITFMINRTVDLPFTNLEKWMFGAQVSLNSDSTSVNLTQEFMLEKGIYEFALGGYYPYSGSAILYLNAVSFVAKVTYIS